MSYPVDVALMIKERSAQLLGLVKDKDALTLREIDSIRSYLREAEGYLDSVRKILDGRPL